MASTKWNQDVNAGEESSAEIVLSLGSGDARDLTGYTLASGIKRHYKSVSEKEQISIVVTSATEGAITLSLSNVQTSNLKSGKYLYDVELQETATGIKERVIEGVIEVRPEVTVT